MPKLHQKDLLLEFPFYPDENRKWGRVDLSPKKKILFTPYKNVSIRIVNNEDEAAIVRITDLLDKNDQPELDDRSNLDPRQSQSHQIRGGPWTEEEVIQIPHQQPHYFQAHFD
ncbi:hypothetical protein J4E80_010771 [Alternaria sp. BMP 0032]|nr:hypothetical protein J4E80_010771 [Alternaria sp. BMP 0032]